MMRHNRFIGLTPEERMAVRLSLKRKIKYPKVVFTKVVCGCGMEMWYTATRCPCCEAVL